MNDYNRQDTLQSWFEDGELWSEWIDYKRGDTTYHYTFSRYKNRNTQINSLERSYPAIFKSEFDPGYESKGSAYEILYSEEYYENGSRKFLYQKDTSFYWHENGHVKLKRYSDGAIEFDENGLLMEKSFHWQTRGPSQLGDLDHMLIVTFLQGGRISKIEYVRDQVTKDGVAGGVRYLWKWNQDMKLVESPKRWREEVPWKKFKEIKI